MTPSIRRVTSTRQRWEIVRMLQTEGVQSAPVQTIHEVAEDEHWKARGMIQVVDYPRRGRVMSPAAFCECPTRRWIR